MRKKDHTFTARRNLIFILILFIVFTILAWQGISAPSIRFDSTDTALTLSGPEDTSVQLAYADITSAELVNEPDYGSAAGGGVSGKIQYGLWENESWGSYQSFISTGIPCCIVLSTEDTTVAFNLENQDTTKRLYDSLLEYGNIGS